MNPVAVDAAGLQKQIDALAGISEAPAPVVTRILFSEADQRGRTFVKHLCSEAGLVWREDAVGNLFAHWRGRDAQLAPIATGSHIDAIPNAGRYDGVVGVLGALAAIRALQRAGFEPRRAIELIVFTAEEPTRFGIGCLGSRLLSGALTLERAAALRDPDGQSLEAWRSKAGFGHLSLDSVRLPKNCYAGFVELHIEQGPLLEKEEIPIGVVEKIAAPSSLRAKLTGEGGHAGAVLMRDRRDALLAGAEIALVVEQVALSGDLRDTNLKARDAALERIEQSVATICARRGIEYQIERVNADVPAVCDPRLIRTVSAVCDELGLAWKRMISRAYHDTLFMTQICPATMIFVPCRAGVSHRPDEYSSPEQIGAGVRVLAHTLAKLAE
jgi:N-carbamoyl-L-amino-acid hydrolase